MALNSVKILKLIKLLIIRGLGLTIMVMDGLYTFGGVHFPNPSMLSKPTEILIAFIVGLTLFVVPIDFLEKTLEKLINKKSDEV